MPSEYQSKSGNFAAEQERLTAAELARYHSLARLIRAYEAVRLIRGPERDAAERALGVALARHGEPFQLGDWIWRWSKSEQAIFRHKAVGMHLLASHMGGKSNGC